MDTTDIFHRVLQKETRFLIRLCLLPRSPPTGVTDVQDFSGLSEVLTGLHTLGTVLVSAFQRVLVAIESVGRVFAFVTGVEWFAFSIADEPIGMGHSIPWL
jgi:hypothetical protein